MQYEVANGDEIPNLGFSVVTEEGTVRGMRPQVVDVSKALQSVRALVRTGHVVVFGDGENDADHYSLNRATGESSMVRDDGLNYLMTLYVVAPAAQLSCLQPPVERGSGESGPGRHRPHEEDAAGAPGEGSQTPRPDAAAVQAAGQARSVHPHALSG